MRWAAGIALAFAGCGPTVPTPGQDSTGGQESTTASATTAATTSTSAGTTVATSVTTSADTSGADDGETVDADAGDDVVDDGGFFICRCDGGVVTIECDIWAQDCPRGEKCMPWANDGGSAWNATRCTPVDDTPGQPGDPCTVEGNGVSGIDDCAISSMCWDVDPETNTGTCVGFCGISEANPECPDALSCFIGFEGVVAVCVPECDPLSPMCAADEACIETSQVGAGGFFCLPTPPFEPSEYGEVCEGLFACDTGLACVEAYHVPDCAGTYCCTTVGDLAQTPVCLDPMQSCIPFDQTMPDSGLCYCGVPA